jgi:hypothetical protein
MSARRGVAWLALASFLSPSTLPLLAAAWLLAHHADAHAHTELLEADAGHFVLVLAHDEGEAHEHDDHTSHGHRQAEPRHAGDHVVHFGGDGAAWQARRLAPDDVPALPLALELAPAPAVQRWIPVAPPPRARDTLLLRTVVLRL